MAELKRRPDRPDDDPEIPEVTDKRFPGEGKHLTDEPVTVMSWERDIYDDRDDDTTPSEKAEKNLERLTAPTDKASRAERARRAFVELGADVADGLKDPIDNMGDIADRPPTRATVGEPKSPYYKAPDVDYGWGDSFVGLVALAVVSVEGAHRATQRWKEHRSRDAGH